MIAHIRTRTDRVEHILRGLALVVLENRAATSPPVSPDARVITVEGSTFDCAVAGARAREHTQTSG